MFQPLLLGRILSTVSAIAALSAVPAHAGQVWVVQGPGTGHYPTIQAAVDAAGDGGILVAGPGTYAPFVIDGKSIVLYAAEGANAQVAGTIEIKNLASGKAVFVAGLTVTGVETLDGSSPALRLSSSFGQIRFRDCVFQGGRGTDTEGICTDVGRGSAGAIVDGCTRVAFASCTLAGGRAGSIEYNYECEAFDGGDGLAANASTISLVRCTCTGGNGGNAGEVPGNGGRGCAATGNGFVASGTTFTGGRGGDAWDFIASNGGDGGDGVFLGANTGVHVLDCALAGGAGGTGLDTPGDPGAPSSGPGTTVNHTGAVRWVAGPRISRDATTATITFHGTQGDQMIEQGSSVLDFHLFPAMAGFRFILPPLVDLTSTVTVPASGVIDAAMPVPDIAAPTVATMLYTQGTATDPQTATFLENALDVLVLNRGAQPDCNGNGVLDYFDVREGTSPDCDGNLVPDECDIATGAGDCNANQVPDACDIASGASEDVDHDGVPDECQAPVTWYVDPAAAAGGDGSLTRPFRTIRPAIAASQSGDTILLRDGLYTGADCTNLVVGDPLTSLTIRSERGPQNCTIDCQGQGRAFTFNSTSSQRFVLDGVTIRNGTSNSWGAGILVSFTHVTFRNCVIRNCAAVVYGGGIYVQAHATIVEDCEFVDDSVVTTGFAAGGGGALGFADGSGSVVRRCRFTGNTAKRGGALYCHNDTPGWRLSHCTFDSNSATQEGGALWVETPSRTVDIPALEIDDCLFSGNACTGPGGGVYTRTSSSGAFCRMRITSSTFSGNSADHGGAVGALAGSPLEISNSILWDDSAVAGTGAEIALLASPGQDPPDAIVEFCDVEGGAAGIEVAAGTLQYGAGNLSIDPLFTASYELSGSSPCIDAGDDSAVLLDASDVDGDGDGNELVPWDLARRARLFEDPYVPDTGVGPAPIVDMGAFERWVPRRAHVRSHP